MNKLLLSALLLLTCAMAHAAQGDTTSDPFTSNPDRHADPLPRSVVHFHLSGPLVEMGISDDAFTLTGESVNSTLDLMQKLERARQDDSVAAVVLTWDALDVGWGQIAELHHALMKYREAGKPIHVHVDQLTLPMLAALSPASELCVVPTGDLFITGLYSESLFAHDLLTKLGVEADFIHIGDYKAAAEMMTNTEPSPQAAENMNWLLDSLYGSLVGMIEEGRGLTAEEVKGLIDTAPHYAGKAQEAGLIDAVEHREDFVQGVRDTYGNVIFDNHYGEHQGPKADLSSPLGLFSLFQELAKQTGRPGKDAVAIIYVSGTINTGYGSMDLFGNSSGAYSGDISRALRDAAGDNAIKAVVLRVDSPGGSALASEIILAAALEVISRKPLVVSMGNTAASGGYYVSSSGATIFADPTTITGSIGVVGGKIVTDGLWDKLGLNFVPYKRGANADLFSTSNAFSETQRETVRNYMLEIYDIFKGHVTASRGDKLAKPIDEIAGGRVFTGAQAKELGLVDELGGLEEAVVYAAKQAGVTEYATIVLPEPVNIISALLGGQGMEDPTDIRISLPKRSAVTGTWIDSMLPMIQQLEPYRAAMVRQLIDRITLMQSESVITMMPFEFSIR